MRRQPVRLLFVFSLLLLGTGGCTSPGETTSTAIATPLPQLPSLPVEPDATASPLQPTSLPTPEPSSAQISMSPTRPEGTASAPRIPYPLNEGVEFEIYTEAFDSLAPTTYLRPPPTTKYIIVVTVPCDTYATPVYAVSGELTEFKWHLAEYDALIQTCLREDMIGSVRVLDMLSLDELVRLFDERYQGYLYLQMAAYPLEVQEMHELYVSYLLGPKDYWDTYADHPFTSEVPYTRINHIYNSYPSQRQVAEADYRLFKLLDEEGIYPLIR